MEKVGSAAGPELLLILIGGLFVVTGVSMALSILWGLLGGGPRDRSQPGQPHLYDRSYYVLMLVVLAGWSTALLSLDQGVLTKAAPDGFLVGWGVMAIGMGLLYLLRFDMIVRAAHHRAMNGFILLRPFHAMRARRFDRQAGVMKIIPPVFLVVGLGVLAFNLAHLAAVPGEVEAGLSNLIEQIHSLLLPG